MGFLPHSQSNMDVSSKRNRWAYYIQDTSRRSLLLRHTDLYNVDPLFTPQQAYFPPCLPPRSRIAQQWRKTAAVAMVWSTWHYCLYPLGLSINSNGQRRSLYGLNTCLGWPLHLNALVRGIGMLYCCTTHANSLQESGVSANHGTPSQ